MDAVVEKCVLLKNLPPDLTESDVREILDRGIGDPHSSKKYEKVHRHEERKNDVRWIVLFKTKADARNFLSVGDFEGRSSKGRYVVKPDYCSGCIVPEDWLEEDNLQGKNEAEGGRLDDDDLERMSIRSDELFSSFVVVQQTKPDQTKQSTETESHKPTSTVPNKKFDYPNNESVSSNELFGSGLCTEKNGQTAPDTSLSSSPLSSSDMIGDDIENKSKIDVGSERGASSYGLHGLNSSTDKSKTLSASVLSVDLFGSGRDYESMKFDYHREENSETEKEVFSEAFSIQCTVDTVKTMGIKGKTKETYKSGDIITKSKDKSETEIEKSLRSTKEDNKTNDKKLHHINDSPGTFLLNSSSRVEDRNDIQCFDSDRHALKHVSTESETMDMKTHEGPVNPESTFKDTDEKMKEISSTPNTQMKTGNISDAYQQVFYAPRSQQFYNPSYANYYYPGNLANHAFRPMMHPQMTTPYPGFPQVNPLYGMYPMVWQNFPMLQTSAQEYPTSSGQTPALVFVPMYMPHPGMPSTAPATGVTTQQYDEVQTQPQSQETKTADSRGQSLKPRGTTEYKAESIEKSIYSEEVLLQGERGISTDKTPTAESHVEDKCTGHILAKDFSEEMENASFKRGGVPERPVAVKTPGQNLDREKEREKEEEKENTHVADNSFSSATDSEEHIYDEIADFGNSQKLYSTADKLEQTLTKSRKEKLANRPMLPLPKSVDSGTDTKKTNVTTPNKNTYSVIFEADKEHAEKQEKEDKTSEGNRRILVRGFSDEISCEALELYFENKTVGGNILSADVDKKKQQAVIEFESEKDAEKILERALKGDKFSLQGHDLEVLEYNPPEFDPLKVFIQNIANTTTDECIVNFVEGRCNSSPKQVIRGETPGTAMLCFHSPPDVKKLQGMCASRRCEGQYWTVTLVERSRSVKVTSLRSSSKDSVSLYFENRRRSGGGDVENVEFRENYEDCIVTFRLAADAEHVCERSSHTIDSQVIDVRLHYPYLELDEDFIITIPPPFAFEEIDEHICKFLSNCPQYKERIENAVASHNGRIIWDEDCSFKVGCIVDSKDRRGFEKLKNWSEKCKLAVEDIIDELMVEKSDNIAVEVWPEFKTRLMEISVPDPQAVAVILVDFSVVVVGNKGHVPLVFDQVTSVVDDIREKVKRENQVITKKIKIKKYEMALLRASRVDRKLSKPLDEFKLDENGEIMCKGKQKDVDEFLRKLRVKLKAFVSKQVPGFTKEAKNLLFQKAARDYIKAKLNKEKLLGVWDVARGSDLVMYSKNEKDLEEAINILRSSVKMETMSLDATNASVLLSDDGRKHLQNLESKYEGMVIFHIQSSEVQFACTDDVLKEIKSEINSFLDLNTIISDFLDVCIGTYSFIVQYEYKKLKSIEEQYSRLSVTVETREGARKQGFKVSGKKDGCKLAIRHLRSLIDSVAHKDYKVSWPGFDKYIKSPEGVDEIKAVELAEKCVVKVSFEDYRLSQEAKSIPGEPDTTKLERGPSERNQAVKKNLTLGALATQKVDVIVNSANSNLDLHVGRISNSLLKAAGDQLQWECKSKYPDGLGVDEIAVTSGGALQCKELFHGVLVKWDGGDGHAEKVMVHFVRACLQLASSKQYRSIAFPALGTGALGFPADVVANLMNATVDDFATSNVNTSLKNVVFVVWEGDAETVKAFREALTLHKRTDRKSLDDIKRRYSTLPRADNIVVQGDRLTSSINSVKLEVLKGDLTQEHSAAIVNSTTDDLNLNTGAISKAILQAAGNSVQLEATFKKKEFETNGLVCTNPGRLMCEKIIHVRARNGTRGWMETIQKCLKAAESLGLNSIAFPALGTGGKAVPADRMASAMIKALQDYIQDSSEYQGCLKSIRIVIFDDKMLSVFITEVRKALDPSQKSKSLFQDLKFWERKVEETTQNTTFHIFGDSKFVIDRAVKKIEEIRKERMIVLIPTIREQFNESHLNDIRKICQPYKARAVVGSSGIVRLIGYGKTVDTAYTKVQEYLDALWKHILDNSALSVGLPKTWSDMKITDKTKVVALKPANSEYTTVLKKFATETSGSGQLTVVKIERIQNPTLYMQYAGKKRQMETINAGGNPVERQLWHGTRTRESVDNIIQKGFDRNYNTGSAYGVGVYFGVQAATSLGYSQPNANGERYMFLADVLTGEYCAARGAIRVPPSRSGVSGTLTYDSTTDNVATPSLFVIYHDSQAYPTHLITFR